MIFRFLQMKEDTKALGRKDILGKNKKEQKNDKKP